MVATTDPSALIPPIARALAVRYHQPVDELIQAGRIAALAAVATVDPGCTDASAQAYLRLRIRGAMVDQIRREFSRREVSFDTGPEISHKCDNRRAQTMGELLLLLPPRSRAMLELRIQGFSQAETGAAMGVSQSRISRLEARAVGMLRRRAG